MGPRGPLLVFDGECGFCTTAARFVERRFRDEAHAAPWQLLGEEALSALGLSAHDAAQAAWWVTREGALERGHRAVGRALQAGGGGRALLGWFVLHPPPSLLAAVVYRVVVRYRHRLPGGTPACRLGGADARGASRLS